MDKAFKSVQQLVKDFGENEAAYLAPNYQESQVRQDFIDKLFAALGWDVTHERQKNPYEQEVTIEKNVQTAGSQRRADYAFFIAPNFRDVKFFVEAKKPAHDLKNPDYYHQAIRYGWNQGTPLAVLTDFEEFHILDCRYKPNIETALHHTIKVYRYKDYADKEKFAEIFYLFGRDAVADGSIEKFAATLPKPRGKAIQKGLFKGGYQPVDEAFLEELDGYRETLAKAFKKENQKLEGEELTEAVQRTIDRLVFIRFLEDKQIEDPAIIAFREKQSAWGAFLAHCKILEPKYNGLVFKPHRIVDGKEFSPPDDNAFADICSNLADPSSPYDFNHIPISILGSIYERFLGKVVHATDKRVTVQEKPEVRKAGGVYYTPEYIVRYIVSETVGKLIEGKTPDEIAQMAFADIACGSGSFLIEVYSQLLEYHARYYAQYPGKACKDDIAKREGKTVLSLKKRQEILLNNIYGVDIDFQATEVTQLSLYLKLLEEATMNDSHQFGLLKEKILPDLRNNIICGNSLIGTDILEGDLFGREEDKKLNPMNFADAFPKIMKRGGFDAVVGNPPYVRQEGLGAQKEYFQKKFKVYHGTADLFTYFIEKGISLLRSEGRFSYIVANKWMRSNYGEPLRQWLANQCIERIIDFGDMPVFGEVTTYPCILIVSKNTPQASIDITKIETLDNLELSHYVEEHTFSTDRNKLDKNIWTLMDETSSGLVEKLKSSGIPLGKYVKEKIFYGVKTGLNEAFVIDKAIKKKLISKDSKCAKLIKPFLAGKDIKRYESPVAEKFLILIPSGWTRLNSGNSKDKWKWMQSNYPSIAKHLISYQKACVKRWDKGEYWWELRPCAYYDEFEIPKIMLPDISLRGNFILDNEKKYCVNTCYIIASAEKYLLGLLNSKLITFFYSKLSSTYRGGYLRFIYQYLEQLPIRTINFSDPEDKARHDRIVKLVEQMLDAKEQRASAKTEKDENKLDLHIATLDHHIDEAVYELYGLTEEEIKVVEG